MNPFAWLVRAAETRPGWVLSFCILVLLTAFVVGMTAKMAVDALPPVQGEME